MKVKVKEYVIMKEYIMIMKVEVKQLKVKVYYLGAACTIISGIITKSSDESDPPRGPLVGSNCAKILKQGDRYLSIMIHYLTEYGCYIFIYYIYLDQNAEFLRQPTRNRIKFGHPLVSGPQNMSKYV
eukprot:sb/3475493/